MDDLCLRGRRRRDLSLDHVGQRGGVAQHLGEARADIGPGGSRPQRIAHAGAAQLIVVGAIANSGSPCRDYATAGSSERSGKGPARGGRCVRRAWRDNPKRCRRAEGQKWTQRAHPVAGSDSRQGKCSAADLPRRLIWWTLSGARAVRALLGGNREPEPQTAKTRRSGGSCIDGRGKPAARVLAETSFPYLEPDFKRRFRATGGVCPEGRRFPARVLLSTGGSMFAVTIDLDAYDNLPPRQLKAMLRALRFADEGGVVHASLTMLATPGPQPLDRAPRARRAGGCGARRAPGAARGRVPVANRPEVSVPDRSAADCELTSPSRQLGRAAPQLVPIANRCADARIGRRRWHGQLRPMGRPSRRLKRPSHSAGRQTRARRPRLELSSGSKEPSERERALSQQDEIPDGWEEAAAAERRLAGLGPVNLPARVAQARRLQRGGADHDLALARLGAEGAGRWPTAVADPDTLAEMRPPMFRS